MDSGKLETYRVGIGKANSHKVIEVGDLFEFVLLKAVRYSKQIEKMGRRNTG
jgi:hypothetical protein